ncbi:MAG: hypothetical protein KDB14_19955 [Planctomycetales bacterium]|nr:hypothetical protein [Planctomycetales bacterium]
MQLAEQTVARRRNAGYQGHYELVRRVASYWLAATMFITLALALVYTYRDPQTMFFMNMVRVAKTHWSVFVAASVMLPMMMYDLVGYGRRFAGPMQRLRNHLDRAARGEEIKPIVIRSDDFWTEMVESMNSVLHRLQELSEQQAGSQGVERPVECAADEHAARELVG